MDKLHRHTALIRLLKATHLPIALTSLTQQFNCSEKTIRRDLEQLKAQHNAPWFISNNQVYCDKSWQHPIELQGYWFDKKEIESLFALNQIIQQLSASGLKHQLEPFQHRINELLTQETNPHNNPLTRKVKLIEIAERAVPDLVFETLVQALAENKQVHIHFWNRHTDQHTQRTLSPQQLIRYKDNWIVDAYCHLRNALRSFSLEAITEIQLHPLPAKEIDPKTLNEHYQTAYGIYAGQANKTAVIKFSPYIARWVQNENWHPQQIGTWQPDQSYQLQIPYNQDNELVQDILKYGEHAEVRQPPELREKIHQKLKEALKHYKNNPA
ncbi:MAG: hypothetical protein CO158_01320 [Piscirickettsiaceae bacterium CG_4_9_14_3_um_filter_43_564]|nr:transcriptional regulator [Thiomicrospira sp.]OIP95747.1 MAG: hypothetical protein AUK56_04435 [Thiomicrospira sp. CG2_30_44_34]PIQ06072.1 MAG: hypothetical protein COW74_01575 [Piscirickettsiaceae bacterium CG18_big_fil_WC_8_21_14_2_50_44_103]PIU39697.1 MAG: hypothetical protein COT01_00080 [Piscirickettsiaceae bacterium CG07_land_8_20_14_0_80_44_28]PIX78643.1 MAG: hypothetical protein COZ36_07855 [Piscirickettsiaceae bacterium CG_4_10_14_3_um_filter_44_349]PIZ72541.1 MAG: hypothetical pro